MLEQTIDDVVHRAPTVEELRAHGYRLHLRHLRYPDLRQGLARYAFKRDEMFSPKRYRGKVPAFPKGGLTHAVILSKNGTWAEAFVQCSREDSYVKRTGYILAVERALKDLVTRDEGVKLLTDRRHRVARSNAN